VGLVTWRRVLTGIIQAERYELDGFIFAVWCNDLRRRFYVVDNRNAKNEMAVSWATWDSSTYPKSWEQVQPFLRPSQNVRVLSPVEFESAVQGRWPASVARPFRLYLTYQILGLTKALLTPLLNRVPGGWRVANWLPTSRLTHGYEGPDGTEIFDETARSYQAACTDEVARVIRSSGIPTLVVYIPGKPELLRGDPSPSPYLLEVKKFAEALGARFCDGRQIFQGMSRTEIDEHYYPSDFHWNQAGSDLFAQFMAGQLSGPIQK